jgi:hypothetical protein
MRPPSIRFALFVSLCVTAATVSPRAAANQKPAPAQPDAAEPSAAPSAVATSFWRIYHNDEYGFEVKYPDGWRVSGGSGTGVEIIAITQPVGAGEPRGSLTLAIQRNENPKKLSIKEWFAEQLRTLKSAPESQGAVTIGGQPAMFMENTNSSGRQHSTFTLLHETDVLSFGYTRQAQLEPTYAAIMASFHVVK